MLHTTSCGPQAVAAADCCPMLCPCSTLCAIRAVVIDMLKEKETFKRSEVIEAAQQRVRGVKGPSTDQR